METRVGHVHIHYRVPKCSPSATAALPTLDRLVRERLADPWDRALRETFDDDPAVYIVRKVFVRIGILAPHLTVHSRLAEQWSKRLCASVVRCIAAGEDHDNLVCFANQAEFVASFLADFVKGRAWGHWYYGTFQSYRRLSESDVILAVLQDNRECIWDILRRLRGLSAIEAVLALLGIHGQRMLWGKLANADAIDESPDTFRIFVESAYWMMDALALWSGPRPSEAATLAAYLHTKPTSPQWTSSSSLAEAVADVIRFLARQSLVSCSRWLENEAKSDLERALNSRLDWLDTKHLASLAASILKPPPSRAEASFVLRPIGITPAQKALLEKVRRLILEGQCRLDGGAATSEANLLRLITALSEQLDPASLSAATAMLESIVETWMVLRTHPCPADAVGLLRQAAIGPILAAALPRTRAAMAHHLERVARLGDPAIAVVEELITQSGDVPVGQGTIVQSQCAGLFLLTRALQDIRLGAVLKECGFDMVQPLLVGLAIKIGGRAAWENGILDPGAGLWTGCESEAALESLRHLESLDRDRFDAGLCDLLSAQRLIDLYDGPSLDEGVSLPCSVELDAMLDRTAARTLRAWARWLPGFGQSSASYLLSNFIRRPGWIEVGPRFLQVHLTSGPLDGILRMAGYLSESPAVSWLGNRTVRFHITS
ncbi:hypothetical protein [Nitrospira sp. Nam80]